MIVDWAAEAERFKIALTSEQVQGLASQLGVTIDSLEALGCGWADLVSLRKMGASGAGWQENYPNGAYALPERSGGRLVGFSLRTLDGRKGAPAGRVGAKRGLIIAPTLKGANGPILVVEGASDVAAAMTLGLPAVGRPSNTGGVEALTKLLSGREPLVVGENDQKDDGHWPGRDGAEHVARELAAHCDEPVRWTLPPAETKDLRAWLNARAASGLDLNDAEACKAAGREVLAELLAASSEAKKPAKPKQSELLVRLALEKYRIGVSTAGEPFAVPLVGPNVALMFRGSRDALRSTLAREYRARHGTVPSASALSDAMTVLQGEALACPPERIDLRVALDVDGIVMDLGRADGQSVVIRPNGWELLERSPVLFRRTELTGEMAVPVEGGDVSLLRSCINVSGETWPLLLGYLVAAFFPDISHPILLLGGQQGTGKSTTARYLVGLVDPSPAPLRSPPINPEQWAISAAGSWAVVVDNLSIITDWFSDALCKASTGDGWLRRKLYTDGELAVLAFRRVVILTSIDPGAMKGDLGDRLVVSDLERIDDSRRVSERVLDTRFADHRASILGGLLDLVVLVLRELATMPDEPLPRMADFGRILQAMDRVLGTTAFKTYVHQRDRIAREVVEDDAIGTAIVALLEKQSEWSGNMKALHELITPDQRPAKWPKTSRALSGCVRRVAPAMLSVGIEVIVPDSKDKTRRFVIRRTAHTAQSPSEGSEGPLAVYETGIGSLDERAVPRAVDDHRPPDRPNEQSPVSKASSGSFGRSGDLGGGRRDPFVDVPSPAIPCRACGHQRWWRQRGENGVLTCGVCHPPTRPGDIEWHDDEVVALSE
jgi:hypothetical protein